MDIESLRPTPGLTRPGLTRPGLTRPGLTRPGPMSLGRYLHRTVFRRCAAALLVCVVCGPALAASLRPDDLRVLRANLPSVTVYPSAARSQHLEGRILLEFHLRKNGQLSDVRIVKADAAETLQTHALELLRDTSYDLNGADVDATTVFHASVIYCMDHCREIVDYPESNSLLRFTTLPLPGH
jgi:TonB family protein